MKLLLCLLSGLVLANQITIEDTKCVKTDAQKAHDALINYEGYQKLDDGYRTPLMGTEVQLIDMIKSQSKFSLVANGPKTPTKALVWVVLQPFSLGANSTDFYPRFLLECDSQWLNEHTYQHDCKMRTDKQHYALDSFTSTMTGVQNNPECVGGSQLKYKVELETDSLQVEEIKKQVNASFFDKYPLFRLLMSKDQLKNLINDIFDEDKFFSDYYQYFYNTWAKNLEK